MVVLQCFSHLSRKKSPSLDQETILVLLPRHGLDHLYQNDKREGFISSDKLAVLGYDVCVFNLDDDELISACLEI